MKPNLQLVAQRHTAAMLYIFSHSYLTYTAKSIICSSKPGRGKKFISSTKRLHRLRGSSSLLLGDLCREQRNRAVRLITHLRLVPKLRMSGAIGLLPLHASLAHFIITVTPKPLRNRPSFKIVYIFLLFPLCYMT